MSNAERSIAQRGITPFKTTLRYRDGLGPAYLQGRDLIATYHLGGNVSHRGKIRVKPKDISVTDVRFLNTHQDWYQKFEVVD